jgi:DNA sulfur modification protein DndD
MKYYLKKFAKEKIEAESDGFIWLLYFVYCSLIDSESNDAEFWENFKERIKTFNFQRRTVLKIRNCSQFFFKNMRLYTSTMDLTFPKSKIKTLQVKDFRGFGSSMNAADKGIYIEFNPQNTIFYGPNGSGKSSMCDALEYKLTGQVKEAIRRNRRVSEYIRRIGSAYNPHLTLSFSDSTIDVDRLTDDEKNYYSQAFIEKNRIQEFSLFGSKDTGIKKEQILSILIGMDELSALAKSLVQPPAFKSNLSSFKRSLFANKITSLISANITNLTLKKAFEDAIVTEKAKGAALLFKGEIAINDLEEELKIISSNIALVNAETISVSGIPAIPQSQFEFETIITVLESNLKKYDELDLEITKSKLDLSYSNLYAAIEELKAISTVACPACDTPLGKVTKNPFSKATEELIKLKKIKDQEKEFFDLKTLVLENFKTLESFHNNLLANILNTTSLGVLIPEKSIFKSKSPSYSLESRYLFDENAEKIKKEIKNFQNYFTELNSIYQKQTKREQIISANNQKIESLNLRKGELDIVTINWINNQKKLDEINNTLETYSEDLSKLTNEKTIEDEYNSFIDLLIQTYPYFYNELQSFKDKEFQTRFGNIENEIAGFYAQINKHDPEHDTVESFKINNLASDYKIEYKIKGSSFIEDASIKFSEGHLRSLGLSILLANAKINELPFIIFDDVVNAIDSDHRANIIEMMVNDKYLGNTQQIISTHDRLYWERFSIENQEHKFDSYILKCTKGGIVHYHYNLSFREKIHIALANFDIRQALLYSRIWFESIAKQYCMENNIELKGYLRSNDFTVSVEPTLGSIYRALNEKLLNNDNLKILHQDEINFKGINQEHHSFDEFNFNFIHSRTSIEVQKIFEAVNGLDKDLRILKNYKSILENLIEAHKGAQKRLRNLNSKMPPEIQTEIKDKYIMTIDQLTEFLENIGRLKIESSEIVRSENRIKILLIDSIITILVQRQQTNVP